MKQGGKGRRVGLDPLLDSLEAIKTGKARGSARRRRAQPRARTDPAARPSAGSPRRQCVLVNLRLDCAETRLLGVSKHVCEVQILLEEFSSLLEVPRARAPPAKRVPFRALESSALRRLLPGAAA